MTQAKLQEGDQVTYTGRSGVPVHTVYLGRCDCDAPVPHLKLECKKHADVSRVQLPSGCVLPDCFVLHKCEGAEAEAEKRTDDAADLGEIGCDTFSTAAEFVCKAYEWAVDQHKAAQEKNVSLPAYLADLFQPGVDLSFRSVCVGHLWCIGGSVLSRACGTRGA